MPSRRSHTNSHHGCLQCKAKRVKCDQLQPKCSRCEKRGSDCTYRHLMTSYNPFQGHEPQQVQGEPSTPWSSQAHGPQLPATKFKQQLQQVPATPVPKISWATTTSTTATSALATRASDATPPTIPPSPSPATDPSDVYLLHHYTTNLTVAHMSPFLDPDLFPTLNVAILRHVHSVPYVRHVALSFSAHHLAAITHPGHDASSHRNLLSIALSHKASALSLFRPALDAGISPASAEPLLVASAVLLACELALPAADPLCRTRFHRIDILAQVAGLFQGANHIYRHGSAYISTPSSSTDAASSSAASSSSSSYPSSPEAARIGPATSPPPNGGVPWAEAQESVRHTVDVLYSLPHSSDPDEEGRRNIIKHAALELWKTFDLISCAQKDLSALCTWLGTVKKEFVRLVQERNPLALVLVAHWAVCRPSMDVIWWARGWPAAAVRTIHETLDDSHKPLLKWCLLQAEGQMPSASKPSTHTIKSEPDPW